MAFNSNAMNLSCHQMENILIVQLEEISLRTTRNIASIKLRKWFNKNLFKSHQNIIFQKQIT